VLTYDSLHIFDLSASEPVEKCWKSFLDHPKTVLHRDPGLLQGSIVALTLLLLALICWKQKELIAVTFSPRPSATGLSSFTVFSVHNQSSSFDLKGRHKAKLPFRRNDISPADN
jgi:hypothetical protein